MDSVSQGDESQIYVRNASNILHTSIEADMQRDIEKQLLSIQEMVRKYCLVGEDYTYASKELAAIKTKYETNKNDKELQISKNQQKCNNFQH